MKNFSLENMMYVLWGCCMLSTIIGLSLNRICPKLCDNVIFPLAIIFILTYTIIFVTIIRIVFLMEERKIYVSIHDTDNREIKWGINEIGLGLGIFSGIITHIVGTTFDNHFYPCLYFYWQNLGWIILFGTLGIFILQFQYSLGINSFVTGVWKIHNERRKSVSYQNFKFGQKRRAGFCLCYIDLAVIGIAILTTLLLQYFSENNTLFQILTFLPVIVVVHFFLFCNVFRISLSKKVIWSCIFMMNITFWIFISQDILNLWTCWRSVLIMQTPFTIIMILSQILSTQYCGIVYDSVPWSDEAECI